MVCCNCLMASLIVIPAVGHAENAPVDTKADVQKLAEQWMDAYNKKDAATIAKMYTDDAVVSFDQWTAAGRAAFQAALNKEFPADTKFTAITVDQSQRVGDLNIARGTWAADAEGSRRQAYSRQRPLVCTVGMCRRADLPYFHSQWKYGDAASEMKRDRKVLPDTPPSVLQAPVAQGRGFIGSASNVAPVI